MNILCQHRLVVAMLIALCFGAGCTAPASSAIQKEPSDHPVIPLSIRDTPVQYADVNGVRLAYREFGGGEPLLVIVGLGATMDQVNETALALFASQYHVFLYDHRGMGQSSFGNETPTIPLYAKDAADLIAALGYDSMHIYGTSMGSFIAQEMALNTPGRVRKMILDSSSYSISIPEMQELHTYAQSIVSDPAAPQGLRDEASAILAWNGTWNRLHEIDTDVMLVVGTQDTITPDILSARMAGKINGSWLIRFSDLPHAGGDVDPVRYADNALYFLKMPGKK